MAKAKSQQSLDRWTKQKWRTKSGKPSTQGSKATGERYLPEAAMKERMLEVELREEKAESQKFMAWVAMGMMIVFTVILFTPLMTDTRVQALADLLGLFYIAQTGVVAAYMGATAYMAGKPMGNKVAMKKDMR